MSMLDTIYDMNKERIRKGKRVITYDQETGTIYSPLGEKEKEKKDEGNDNGKS